MAQGIVGSPLPDLDSIYAGRIQKKARHIAADPTHPGNGLFVPLPSGKWLAARWVPTCSCGASGWKSPHPQSWAPRLCTYEHECTVNYVLTVIHEAENQTPLAPQELHARLKTTNQMELQSLLMLPSLTHALNWSSSVSL
ncbi:hypothetical protein L3Q82_019966, partial [Scortum barcoo]